MIPLNDVPGLPAVQNDIVDNLFDYSHLASMLSWNNKVLFFRRRRELVMSLALLLHNFAKDELLTLVIIQIHDL